MDNPFESGHIKNYLLLYASVVVIMILFFIASTLFHDVDKIEKKVFKDKSPKSKLQRDEIQKENGSSLKTRLKLMDKKY